MKKLMFAVAAIAAGVAVADVTSANVVGYAGQNTLVDGDQKFVTSQFVKVGDAESEISIQEIKFTTEMEEAADGNTMITLGGGGEATGSYVWMYFDDLEKFGWADAWADYIYANKKFLPGEAFWLQNNYEETIPVQTSGQVCTGSITVELLTEGDQCVVANSYPVAFDIQNLTFSDAEAADGNTLITLGGGGEATGSYVWMYFDDLEKFGWANAWDDYKYAELAIEPGEGVWVQNNFEEVLYITMDPPASIQALAD